MALEIIRIAPYQIAPNWVRIIDRIKGRERSDTAAFGAILFLQPAVKGLIPAFTADFSEVSFY